MMIKCKVKERVVQFTVHISNTEMVMMIREAVPFIEKHKEKIAYSWHFFLLRIVLKNTCECLREAQGHLAETNSD